jgi:hypothetical protein
VAKIDFNKERSEKVIAEFLNELNDSWQPRVLPEGVSEDRAEDILNIVSTV